MSLYRLQSGLVFDDTFERLNSRWVLSPSNSCVYDSREKRLTLHHSSDRGTTALFELPQEEVLLMQVHSTYVPTCLGDEGGLVVWKSAMEKVEFLESEDSNQSGDYNIWRAVKRQNLWTFFAHKEGSWELFDSTICLNPTMAGVILKGEQREGYLPLHIDRVILCRGSSVSIGNLRSGMKVELVSEDGEVKAETTVPDTYSGVDIELPSIPFRGRIRIYEFNEETEQYELKDEQEEVTDIYGGDVFLKGLNLKILWKGKELSEVNPTHIGYLTFNSLEQKMTVFNDDELTVAGVSISIAAYMGNDGWEWCDIAHDVGGEPGEYEDTVIYFDQLDSKEKKDFWIRVTRVEDNSEGVMFRKPSYFYVVLRT